MLCRGSIEVLQKRLKMYTKRQHLKENNISNSNTNKQGDTAAVTTPKKKKYTDYYIVIDFEATCEEPNPPGFFHEIIEFPAVLVDAETLEIVRMIFVCRFSKC